MDKALPCKCEPVAVDSMDWWIDPGNNERWSPPKTYWQVSCNTCGRSGPRMESEADALLEWNKMMNVVALWSLVM